jgi:hypothetical protein
MERNQSCERSLPMADIVWKRQLPVSVPDGDGGLLVTQNHTCLPGQTDPMAIVDLDAVYDLVG